MSHEEGRLQEGRLQLLRNMVFLLVIHSKVMHACRLSALVSGLVAFAFAAPAFAQEQATAQTPGAVNPIVGRVGTPKPNPPAPLPEKPRRTRAISPEVAAQLAAAAPKFEALPAQPKPEESQARVVEETDIRDTDKPMNGIVRLPRYIVIERRPPMLRERDILTSKGVEDIAMKRYITETDRALNAFTLPLLGKSREAWASMMYQEDQRLQDMKQMYELAGLVSTTDKAQGQYVKRNVERTFVREPHFGR